MLTKKGLNQMGSKLNESSGSKVSDFALKQMQKFGWKDGQGLGKNENGIVKHIKAVKKEENTGIGRDSVAMEEAGAEWWHDAFSAGLRGVHKKTNSKKKKRKDTDEAATGNRNAPSFEELFAATGGARLGMRARANQTGKLKRTEQGAGPGSAAAIVAAGPAAAITAIAAATSAETATEAATEIATSTKKSNVSAAQLEEEEPVILKEGKSKRKRQEESEEDEETSAVAEKERKREKKARKEEKKQKEEKKEKKEKKRAKKADMDR
jgi:Pin2-interacting protein X1